MSQVLLLVLLFTQANAAPVRLSLKEVLEHAMAQNGELAAERTTVNQAKSDQDRVAGEFGPHLEALTGVGPNFRASGDAVNGSEDHGAWGRTFLGSFSVTEPIYSFGRRSHYARAAESGVAVKQAGVRLKEDELRLQVKEAYYGYLAAKSLLDFVQEGRADFERAHRDHAKMDKKDSFRYELFEAQIDAKEAELKKDVKLAEEGLQLRMGAKTGESFLPKEDWLDSDERKLESIDSYLDLALKNRGEFKQLHEGITAKHNLAKAERDAFLPVLALLTKYEFADTNVRAKQSSPFAYDPYNHDTWTLGLGLKWDLQWGLPQAKAAKYSAEADELEAKSAYADRGIMVDVKRAFWELEEANSKLEAAGRANKVSKKWLSGELMAYGSGLGGKMDDISAAYGARAEAVKSYYEAIFNSQMAWARLSRAVGIEVDPLLR